MIKLSPKLRRIFKTQTELPPETLNPPLFITGCMRSGTSWLVEKLSRHPQLFRIGTELNHIWTTIGGADCEKTCAYRNEEHLELQYAHNMNHYFSKMIRRGQSLKHQIIRLNEYWSRQRGRINYDWSDVVPMNKSPHLINKIRYVHAMYPNSKIILIIRDIYGQVASQKVFFDNHYRLNKRVNIMTPDPGNCWFSFRKSSIPKEYSDFPRYPSDFSLLPQMWIRLNYLAIKELETLPSDSYRIVSFEKLLNDSNAMQELFGFLELKENHSHWEKTISGMKKKVTNTTTSGDPMVKWRKMLSKDEIKTMLSVIEDDRSTYELIQSKIR